MEASSEIGQMVLETADRICAGLPGGPDERRRAAQAWAEFEALGLTRAFDSADGDGLGLFDGLLLGALPGRHGLPAMLADTLTGAWIAARAGLAVPAGPLGLVPSALRLTSGPGGIEIEGRVRVAGARLASAFIAAGELDGQEWIALIPASAAEITPQDDVAGDPADQVRFSASLPHEALAPLPQAHALLSLAGAATRSLLMVNALGAALNLTLAYAPGRSQFGKPLSGFQAIQHSLAQMASHCAAAKVAALDAARAFARDGAAAWPAVAAAKIRVGEAVGVVSSLAHQIHGATGFTQDYPLHRLTRRTWAWRDEFGGESHWSRRLGELALARGGDGLWPLVTTMREGEAA